MVQLRCPKCQTLVLADEGATVRCPSCGFSATAPRAATAAAPRPSVENASPQAGKTPWISLQKVGHAGGPQPLRVISIWAFLLAFIALGTFFFARYGVPFVLGAGAAIMGATSFAKNKQDRHGLVATILGCVALVIGGVYLALQ